MPKTRVAFRAVDELPRGRAAAIVGEPDNFTYLIARTATPDEIAEAMDRLVGRLLEQVEYVPSVEEVA